MRRPVEVDDEGQEILQGQGSSRQMLGKGNRPMDYAFPKAVGRCYDSATVVYVYSAARFQGIDSSRRGILWSAMRVENGGAIIPQ